MEKRLTLVSLAVLPAASTLGVISFSHADQDIARPIRFPIPIAIGKFWDDPAGNNQISAIIASDLQRSGLFRVILSNDLIRETSAVDDAFWKAKGADVVLGGTIRQTDGRIEIRYRLHEVTKGVTLTASGLKTDPRFIRFAAHRVADDVFERLTGKRSPFATRIAYVAQSDNEYRLEIADSDGENAFVALRDSEPVISPAWSPDGTKVAFVSFNLKRPVVYVQELATRNRIAVANFKGSTSAPAWSPDGRRLAIALVHDGSTQIYKVNDDGTNLTKLQSFESNATEPCYSPDGNYIYFTSDKHGPLQIYRMDSDGRNPYKLPLGGTQNMSPAISPNGLILAFVSFRSGKFEIHLFDLVSGKETQLTDGPRDESPSFAPNSQYIIYTRRRESHSNLKVTTIDGKSSYTLAAKGLPIFEPTWGPFTK